MGYATKEKARAGWLLWRARHCPYVTRVCVICSRSFKLTGGRDKRCPQCRHLTCATCGKSFTPPCANYRAKFCSRACKDATLRGHEPHWLAAHRGRKPRSYLRRRRDKHGCAEDREWRQRVFERDNYTCQFCGRRGGRLEADHIKPFSTHPKLRHKLSNGRTLCASCHKQTETYGWRGYWRKVWANRLRQGVLDFSEVAGG